MSPGTHPPARAVLAAHPSSASKTMKGSEPPTGEERLGAGTAGKAQGDPTHVCRYLMGEHRRQCWMRHTDGSKRVEKSNLNKKTLSCCRGVDHRSRLPSEAEESPPLEMPKVRAGTAVSFGQGRDGASKPSGCASSSGRAEARGALGVTPTGSGCWEKHFKEFLG